MIHLEHIETNVTVACENRCHSCNHFVPLQVGRFKSSMIDPEDFAADLMHFGRIAHADAWAAIGGEPTLHPRLVEILHIARGSGIADRIEVWTHGMNLREMSDEFWQSFDLLVVSAYPGKLTDDDLIWIGAQCTEEGVSLEIKDERSAPNFSRLLTTVTDESSVARRYRDCWFKTYSRVLDGGHLYRCCTSPFIGPLLQGRPWGADGLPINEHTTEDDVRRFLADPVPMPSCKICAGRNTVEAVPIPWGEAREPGAWLAASGLPA